MPFKVFLTFCWLFLAALQPQVVQAACNRYRQIRETFFGVPQYVFHTPTSLHSGKRMLHADTDLRHLPVLLLLLRCQLPATRLFFGWRVCRTRGSQPWNPVSF